MSHDDDNDKNGEDKTTERGEPSRHGDVTDTEHPTGDAQAAENAERESPA